MKFLLKDVRIVNGLLNYFIASINKFINLEVEKERKKIMYDIPIPITLEEIIFKGGIEGSEEAYEDDHGFVYSGVDTAFLYYGGDESGGGKPFTGLYYELYPDGKLESYAMYQDGIPVGDFFSFHHNGKVKSYSFSFQKID